MFSSISSLFICARMVLIVFHRLNWASLIAQLYAESTCNEGYPGSIPGSGRSAGEGIGYSLQYSWASLEAQLVKNPSAVWESWVGKIPWKRERLPTPVFWHGEFHGLYFFYAYMCQNFVNYFP